MLLLQIWDLSVISLNKRFRRAFRKSQLHFEKSTAGVLKTLPRREIEPSPWYRGQTDELNCPRMSSYSGSFKRYWRDAILVTSVHETLATSVLPCQSEGHKATVIQCRRLENCSIWKRCTSRQGKATFKANKNFIILGPGEVVGKERHNLPKNDGDDLFKIIFAC